MLYSSLKIRLKKGTVGFLPKFSFLNAPLHKASVIDL